MSPRLGDVLEELSPPFLPRGLLFQVFPAFPHLQTLNPGAKSCQGCSSKPKQELGGSPPLKGCLQVLGWMLGRWDKLREEQSTGGKRGVKFISFSLKYLENTGGKCPVLSRHPFLGLEAAETTWPKSIRHSPG